jgi:heme/copper-type cytochrome/quinol oxidase subunit 2
MALSSAAQVLVAIIPIVGIVMGAVLAFFYLLWSHREKVRLIERGLYEERKVDLDAFCLLTGMLLVSIGIVLSVLFLAIEGFSYSALGGLIPLAVGISFLVFFGMRRNRTRA